MPTAAAAGICSDCRHLDYADRPALFGGRPVHWFQVVTDAADAAAAAAAGPALVIRDLIVSG